MDQRRSPARSSARRGDHTVPSWRPCCARRRALRRPIGRQAGHGEPEFGDPGVREFESGFVVHLSTLPYLTRTPRAACTVGRVLAADQPDVPETRSRLRRSRCIPHIIVAWYSELLRSRRRALVQRTGVRHDGRHQWVGSKARLRSSLDRTEGSGAASPRCSRARVRRWS